MESILLNAITIGLSSLIIPVLIWFLWKRLLHKVAVVSIIVVNALLMIIFWIGLREYLLTGKLFGSSTGSYNYITYGVGAAAFISWGILNEVPRKGDGESIRAGDQSDR